MTTVFQRVRVGPYEIVHEIGRGGMAVVFFATDSRDGRRVALKLVPAGTDRDAQEVLEAERWGAKLQEQFCRISQNVPVVYEHGTEGGYFYIAMEYLDGRNLSEILAAGALAPDRAVGIAIQLCRFPRSGARLRVDDRRTQPAFAAARRFEAAQHPGAPGRQGQGPRLRHRQGAVAQPKGDAQRLRQHHVCVAGAARVGRDRRLRRLLGGRRAAVRDGAPASSRSARRTRVGWSCGSDRSGRPNRSARRVRRRCRRWSPSCSRDVRRSIRRCPRHSRRSRDASCRAARPRPNVKDGRRRARSTTSLRRRDTPAAGAGGRGRRREKCRESSRHRAEAAPLSPANTIFRYRASRTRR